MQKRKGYNSISGKRLEGTQSCGSQSRIVPDGGLHDGAGESSDITEKELLSLNGLAVSSDADGQLNGNGIRLPRVVSRSNDIGVVFKALSVESLQALLEGNPDSIILMDHDFNIRWANKFALSYNPGAVGQTCHQAYIGSDEICQGCPCVKALQTGKVESGIVHTPFSPYLSDESFWEVTAIPLLDDNGKAVNIIKVGRDVTHRVLMRKKFQYRAEFERLMIKISTDLISLQFDEIDDRLIEALGQVGKFADVDRSYIFILADDKTIMANTHEWCADGITSQIQNLQAVELNSLPWLVEKIMNRKVFCIRSVAKMPAEALAEKEHFVDQNIKSLICVPMIRGDELVGFLGFDAVRQEKEWEDEIIDLLQIMCNIFSNALGRKEAEEKLLKSEEFLRTTLDCVGNAVRVTDKDFTVTNINDEMEKITGPVLEGQKCYEKFRNEDCNTDKCILQRILNGEEHVQYEIAKEYEDGRKIVVDMIANPMKREGKIVGMVQSFRDVTQRKQAEESLRAYQKRLRASASELSLAEDRSRRRLAADLHDNIGQLLASSRMKLDMLKEAVGSNQFDDRFTEIMILLNKTIEFTRNLTMNIYPRILFELGLADGLAWFIEQLKRDYDLAIEFTRNKCEISMCEDICGVLYRVCRELLINVTKYSQADQVKVDLKYDGGQVCMRVEDNGIGFDAARVLSRQYDGNGFGLFNIRERLEDLDGRLVIASRPGEGTVVTATAKLTE